MTRPNIKICGLRRREDIAYANRVRPDYIGFVFAESSRRYVPPETARELRRALSEGIVPVGVFVNEAAVRVAELLNTGVVDMAQLHGRESEDDIASLRRLTNRPLIQAFSIRTAEDADRAARSSADYILLDHGPGGTGETFDWSLIRAIGRPFFLAGGLDAGNVADAIQKTRPFAVDVSSGVETGGVKDFFKMQRFTEAVRG